jgi:hypothetical protein
MEEKVFFESGDVKVTNNRFISGSQTFAMSNVTSLRPTEEPPPRDGRGAVFLIGLLVLLVSAGSLTSGAAVAAALGAAIGLGVCVLAVKMPGVWPLYRIILTTSAGETSALVTREREHLDRVLQALNEAIVHRADYAVTGGTFRRTDDREGSRKSVIFLFRAGMAAS